MNRKKWLIGLPVAAALLAAVWAGLNILADPFGVFGDMIFDWASYSQTLNPRNGKAVYISEHFEEYDSYIIGSSAAAAYSPDELNGYLDASFYNMCYDGADTGSDRELVEYLLNRDGNVKYIFLVLGLEEAGGTGTNSGGLSGKSYYKVTGESAASYYARFLFANPGYAFEKLSAYFHDTEMPQAFDAFLPESGCYDGRLRDAEPVSSLSAYLEKNGAGFAAGQGDGGLTGIDTCAEDVAAIREMCSAAGAQLIVVLSPVCAEQMQAFSTEGVDQYYSRLAQAVDYWNFSITPLTYDERYFYDSAHPRSAVGSMVLARMFGNETMYYPENFGVFCENGDFAAVEELEADARNTAQDAYTATIPILLYHDLNPDGEESDTVLHPDTFAHHMELLAENGYRPVTFDDLIAFVEQGTALPENPVVIAFDDGYYSNYEYGFPVLREYGFPATIFVIGSSIGHDQFYKDTEYRLTPHFGAAEINEMVSSGLISIQSHTYDMHQWAPFESGGSVRETIVPLESESEASYIAALTADVEQQNAAFAECGLEPSDVLAFPSGRYTALTDAVLRTCGFRVTVTTESGRVNTLVCGLPQSLIDLGRMTIGGSTTDEAILEYLARK